MCVDHLKRCKTNLELVDLIAGALGLPWQTQCNKAMPCEGKHDLISHVYLHIMPNGDETMLWFSLLLVSSSLGRRQAVGSTY